MAESEKQLRRSAKIRFTRKQREFMDYAKDDKPVSVIDVKFDELADAWRNLELRHDSYIKYVDDDVIETEERWIKEARCAYDEAMEKQHAIERPGMNKTNERVVIDLEKTKLPRFTGSIRDYARFKSDFRRYVEPNIPSSIVAYTLRTCLSKDAAHRIRNTDDISEMWVLLDEKYADAATLADIILDDIQRTRKFRDDETQRFVDFVDKVDDGYHDLCTLGLEREITTTSSVSIIEQKLSPKMSTRWARTVVSDPTVDKSNKLSSLLLFLKTERKSIEYVCAGLRRNQADHIEATIHHVDVSEVRDVKPRSVERFSTDRDHIDPGTCLIHRKNQHNTCDCETYVSKSVKQRFELLKQKAACWSCLVSGHRLRDCDTKKICGVDGCKRRHHRSLHVDNPQRETFSVNHVIDARDIRDAREIIEPHSPRDHPYRVYGNSQGGTNDSSRAQRDELMSPVQENVRPGVTGKPTQRYAPMYRTPFFNPTLFGVVMVIALMNGASATPFGSDVLSTDTKDGELGKRQHIIGNESCVDGYTCTNRMKYEMLEHLTIHTLDSCNNIDVSHIMTLCGRVFRSFNEIYKMTEQPYKYS